MTLPKGWAQATVGQMADFITSGSRGWAKYYSDTGDAFIRIQNIKRGGLELDLKDIQHVKPPYGSEGERTKLSSQDILVTITADLGRIALFSEDVKAYVNQHIALVRLNDPSLAPYIARYLSCENGQSQLGLRDRGITRSGLGLDDIGSVEVPLPPAEEQRRIVAKLDALVAHIARAKTELDRVPALADRQRLAILRAGMSGSLTSELSLSGETVNELLVRVPAPPQSRGGREATEKVISGVAGLAVNDPGTSLPPGWRWLPLLRLARQETGHTPSRSRSDYWDGGVPWIGIRDAGAHHGHRISETQQTISEAGLANSSARLLPAGTVCLSRTASVGYVTIMDRSMTTSQDFATWTCSEALLPEYLMYALMAEGEEIKNFGMGSTHTTIYFPEVRAFHIALPPIVEQKEIVRKIELALSATDRLEAEATHVRALLDRLESAIFAKAFRGELVPQDPNDEPASPLLERIRAQRAAAPKPKRGRRASSTDAS
ncbi:restriction endonuclease subunit S [Mesorhizobium sp. RCC_202]|uniref:restriction endonuclease subunit S n=1 Tax=Mesorhizobium sp. RCC_202 TaxID=3239222 RepID=UPI0035248DA8